LEFNFITDTDVSIDFTYTHAYCDPHTVTFVESNSGETLTWITSIVTDTTMTITATPTLYSEVGEYTIDAVFTDPLSSTKTSIFTLSVVEPCDFDNSNLVVTPTFTPPLAAYAIDDPEATYTVTFEDTISDHFGVDFTCGKWTFDSLTDDQSDTFSAMTTVSGDSESLSWSIFSEDYYALSADTTVTFTLSLTASEMSQTYTEDFTQVIEYTDPCSKAKNWPVITITMTDLIYGVFEELPLTTSGTFSIDDTHDCATSTCGAV
jgi:hypothetical protein